MSWSPTLRHDFGLGKISSSLLSAVCLPHNNAFFNYFTLVLFPGAYMCSVPVGRELSLLAKSPEDAGPGWLEGWLSLPLLPPSTVHVVGFRGCSSVLGFIQGRRISHPQEATQKKNDAHTYYVFQQISFFLSAVSTSFAAMIPPKVYVLFPTAMWLLHVLTGLTLSTKLTSL